jgi:hypothetical protein
MASDHLLTHAQYVAVVKPLLPSKAFAPSRANLWQAGLHVVVVGLRFLGHSRFPLHRIGTTASRITGHGSNCGAASCSSSRAIAPPRQSRPAEIRRASARIPLSSRKCEPLPAASVPARLSLCGAARLS